MCRFLGNFETKMYLDEVRAQAIDRPVYIAGMARSGSTILLECLAAHEQTASHCYRDYPLVSIPLWWNRFVDRADKNSHAPVERFHRDGLFVTPDSPETMEEILWMFFFKKLHRPSQSNIIDADRSHPGFEAFYRNHIRKMLLLRQGRRYLAKNNYHVTRLGYLRKLFPDVRLVVPVRNPFGQIESLIRQHRFFCGQERRDPRILNYMRNAGHFEFGLDRRPINTGNSETVDRIRRLWADGREVDGWALLWKSVYGYVAGRLSAHDDLRTAVLIVDYDDFCRFPEKTLKRLYSHCGLPVDKGITVNLSKKIFPVRDPAPSVFSRAETAFIEAETREIYEKLLSLAS